MTTQGADAGLISKVKAAVPRPVKVILRPMVRPWLAPPPVDPFACADRGVGNEWTIVDRDRTYKFFFLCGGWKSGTHWVQALINLHPKAYMTGEFHFELIHGGFSSYLKRRWRLPAKSRVLQDIAHESLRRCIRRSMFAQTRSHPEAVMLGDRSPRMLKAMLPGAPHILLHRDGRDLLISRSYHMLRSNNPGAMLPRFAHLLSRWGPEYKLNPEKFRDTTIGLLGDDDWVRYLSRFWAESCLHDLNAMPQLIAQGTPVHFIRYEDLHADLEGNRAAIYRFLGLDPAEAAPPSVETKTLPGFKSENLKSATRKGQTGEWRNSFTDRITRIFKEEAAEALVQMGYEKNTNW